MYNFKKVNELKQVRLNKKLLENEIRLSMKKLRDEKVQI